MRLKKPRVATLDEVQISREGDAAVIAFVDSTIATTHLTLGPEVGNMTDPEILKRFNEVMVAQQQLAASYNHIAIEVPPGSPQIRYYERGDQWVARGGVLRCIIEDDEHEPVIHIDEHELSLDQFGTLLRSYAGWGMRIVFVPEDETAKPPQIEVREPEDNRAVGG